MKTKDRDVVWLRKKPRQPKRKFLPRSWYKANGTMRKCDLYESLRNTGNKVAKWFRFSSTAESDETVQLWI
jgi:hypothetical protein